MAGSSCLEELRSVRVYAARQEARPLCSKVEDDFVKRRGVPSGGTVYRIGRYRALLAELASGSCSESRTGEPARPGRPQQSVPHSGGVLPASRHGALCFRSERERPVTGPAGVHQALGSISRRSSPLSESSQRLAARPAAL